MARRSRNRVKVKPFQMPWFLVIKCLRLKSALIVLSSKIARGSMGKNSLDMPSEITSRTRIWEERRQCRSWGLTLSHFGHLSDLFDNNLIYVHAKFDVHFKCFDVDGED